MEREASYDKENSRSSSDLCLQHQKWVKPVCDEGICSKNYLCEEKHLHGRQLHCNASTGIPSPAIRVPQFYSARLKACKLKPQLLIQMTRIQQFPTLQSRPTDHSVSVQTSAL